MNQEVFLLMIRETSMNQASCLMNPGTLMNQETLLLMNRGTLVNYRAWLLMNQWIRLRVHTVRCAEYNSKATRSTSDCHPASTNKH